MVEQEPAPLVALAWGAAATPQRGPRRELTTEQVVAAAVKIADAEGLAAVTMHRVASTFGFTTMAMYRYVPTKDDLHQLMLDAAAGGAELATTAGGWREGLIQWARAVLDIYAAHPWGLDIPVSLESLLLPGQVRVVDAGLRAMHSLPATDDERLGLLMSLSTFVRGHAALLRSLTTATPPSPATTDLVRGLVTDKTHPGLAPLIASGTFFGEPIDVGDAASAEDFMIGLDVFLAGVEATFGTRDRGTGGGADGV